MLASASAMTAAAATGTAPWTRSSSTQAATGVDRVVDDAHPPAADPAVHPGEAIRGHSGCAIASQKGDPQPIGDGIGQERAPLERAAHRVDAVAPQPFGQPVHVGP